MSSAQVRALSSMAAADGWGRTAFGGYKKSGIGRETRKMMLDHYQQTKSVLVSYSTKASGFF